MSCNVYLVLFAGFYVYLFKIQKVVSFFKLFNQIFFIVNILELAVITVHDKKKCFSVLYNFFLSIY